MKIVVLKNILSTLFIFCLILNAESQNSIPLDSGKQIAYTIKMAGIQLPDGSFTPVRIIPIYQLSADQYFPNTIHLKLKTAAKDKLQSANLVNTDPLVQYLNNLSTSSIHAVDDRKIISSDQDIYGVSRIYELTYQSDIDPYDVCKILMNNPDIEYAIPVFKRFTYAYTPNDPQLTSQWALTTIHAREAWDISKGDPNMIIAIVDGGTDWQHPDLASNIWNNPGEIPNNGIDDDTSGKIDDIHGWDFVGSVSSTEIQSGSWKEDNNPKNTVDGHGTHTAGCASASTNNGVGIAGIGFNCKILPVKCGSDITGVAGIYRGYEGILYAARMGAKIISCSWGGQGFSPAEDDIIQQVTAMGSLVVAASGNNGINSDIFSHYPSAYPNVLSVGATASSDQFLSLSNYGNNVKVYAPGENVLSTWLSNGYSSQSGTSMACPVTAGLAGLVRSVHKDWTPLQVIQQIRVTCDNILTPANQGLRHLYWGRINAFKALQYNNDSFPTMKLPGLISYRLAITGEDALKNYNPTNVRLYLRNLLAPVDSILITIQPLSKFINVNKTQLWIYNLATMDSAFFDLNVQLQSNNPWFKGNAELLLTYSIGSYTNIEKINIPVEVSSDNLYAFKGGVSSTIGPQWYGMSSPSKEVVWAVGNSTYYGALCFRSSTFVTNAYRIYTGSGYFTNPLYCVKAFDENNAVAGSGTGYVLKTSSGASSWTVVSVTNYTDFVNDLVYTSTQKGMMLGDPKSNLWGIAGTTDGGFSWQRINNVPAPLSGETGLTGSCYQRNEKIWFGTSKGRLFYSPDFGQSWTVTTVHGGGTVIKMAFYDTLHGIVAYTEAGGTNQTLYLASTSDGGKNWSKKLLDFTSKNLYPVLFKCLPYTRKIVGFFSNGYLLETDDLGLTWTPILSQQSVLFEAGSVFGSGNEGRVWEGGDYFYTLDFKFQPDSTLMNVSPVFSTKNKMQIYPNPCSDVTHISLLLPKGEALDIKLYDYFGRMVNTIYQGSTQGGYLEFPVNTTDLSAGIFFVRVITPTYSETGRIVIKR